MDFHFDILSGSYRNEEGHRNTTNKRNKNDSAWVHIIKFHWTERSHRKHLSAPARQHRLRPIRASLMVMNPESRAWHTQLPLGGVAGDDGIIIFSALSGTHFLTISRLVCKPVCVIAMYVCLDLVTRCHQAWAHKRFLLFPAQWFMIIFTFSRAFWWPSPVACRWWCSLWPAHSFTVLMPWQSCSSNVRLRRSVRFVILVSFPVYFCGKTEALGGGVEKGKTGDRLTLLSGKTAWQSRAPRFPNERVSMLYVQWQKRQVPDPIAPGGIRWKWKEDKNHLIDSL